MIFVLLLIQHDQIGSHYVMTAVGNVSIKNVDLGKLGVRECTGPLVSSQVFLCFEGNNSQLEQENP